MTRGGTPQVSFRMGPLKAELMARTGDHQDEPSHVARRDLGRYYRLLETGLSEVRTAGFTMAEMVAIADSVASGSELNIFGAYGPVVAKIRALSPVGRAALLDATERAAIGAAPLHEALTQLIEGAP